MRAPNSAEQHESWSRAWIKGWVARLGSRCSPRLLYILDGVINYLALGQWMRSRGFHPRRVQQREQVFEAIAEQAGSQRALYLEFGVKTGESLRWWSKHLTDPAAALHAFDSFEGLPADWNPLLHKGAFGCEGKPPEVSDTRIAFFKGWFENTLTDYHTPAHEVMILVLDADLYSSTRTVLERIGPLLRPGDWIYFDELHYREHEMKAFSEFLDRTRIQVSAVATTPGLGQAAFQVIASDPTI